jgi:flavin-dependent dehydrogenase
VDVRLGCRLRDYAAMKDGFTLTLHQDGEPCKEKARALVGADGATSKVRALLDGKRAAPRRYLAIQEWVEASETTPYFSSVFDPEITDYYGWTIPKDDHLVIGAALRPRARTTEKFELLKQRLRDRGFRFGRTVRRESAFIVRPLATRQLCASANGIALLGEAGGWISPSSAEGLSYAFRSACALADALEPGLDDFEHRYKRGTAALRRNIFLKGLKSRIVFNPTLRKAIMDLGIGSMEAYAQAPPRPTDRE